MININEINADAPEGIKKTDAKDLLKGYSKEIAELSWRLLAESNRNILIIFQGMDSSGKDGCTKHVFKYTSPSVVSAHSFKKPTDLEFAHDFLWRAHKLVPRKGRIQIFNRSHYEDVLIQRVHKWISEERVDQRFNAINAFERLLVEDNNTTLLKFYLHLSKERQKEKLIERIERPDKQWKHNDGDWEQRKYWNAYMDCYEDVLNRSEIPWYIVPANSRWYRNYYVAKTILDCLKSMDLQYPPLKEQTHVHLND